MATATTPPTAVGRLTVPKTVLFGRHDDGFPEDLRRSTEGKVEDVRYVDTDHFIIFHEPEAVARIVLEFLNPLDLSRAKG